jgi:D-sedoheptulose 7-phosphate isomerase
MNAAELIKDRIKKSAEVKLQMLNDSALLKVIESVADLFVITCRNKGKILFCGNGGSAADAQHIAAELSGRFYRDRDPLYAEALHVNGSFITAVSNDYCFEDAYARMVKAMGTEKDVLVAISTSGNSENIIRAVTAAKKAGMKVVCLTGNSGGKLKAEGHYLINVPSDDTPRIQEAHILIGHLLCELTEKSLF